jgi:hypothetical protein
MGGWDSERLMYSPSHCRHPELLLQPPHEVHVIPAADRSPARMNFISPGAISGELNTSFRSVESHCSQRLRSAHSNRPRLKQWTVLENRGMLFPEATWCDHSFAVFPPETNWAETGGVYIFARGNSKGEWHPFYVGRAENLRLRLQNHPLWLEAASRGATHIHAMSVPGQADQKLIRERLVKELRPALNGCAG